MTTAYYDIKPPMFEAAGNGSYLYRWNIEQIMVDQYVSDGDNGNEPTVRWQCNEVIVWATVTRAKITEAVIAALWPADYEAKLINDYNAATIGMLGNEYIQRYKTFLEERKIAKERIATDCEALKIT